MKLLRLLLVALQGLAGARAELIALYKFDEISGNTATDSVGTNHANWIPGSQGSPDWQNTAGVVGGAIRLPGSGNHTHYFSIGSLPGINGTPAGMTIATWFKPNGNSGYRGIVMSRATDGSDPFGFGHEDGHLDGRVDGLALDSPGNSVIASGAWYHLAWVWDNVRLTQQLYLNGLAITPTRAVSPQSIPTNVDWRIGDDSCCNNRNLDGLLDDLAIYDTPLRASEIAALHTKGLGGFSADEQPIPPKTDPLNVGLVINEIYHDAEPKTSLIEFVELLNTGPNPIDLSGYRFTDGIEFTFPAGTILGATEYVIVGEDPSEIHRYDGSLSNDGERVRLIDATGNLIDEVTYKAEFPWPIATDGRSMQLINATLDNDLGGAWRPAFPTPGLPNAVFTENSPPQLRQVGHSPQQPTSADLTTVSIKASDPDGIASVTLHYQVNRAGDFEPAFLPLPGNTLKSDPGTPLQPNPDFEEGWVDVPMTAFGTIYQATIPPQGHRTLVRYRITATDSLGNTIRAPFPEDSSLNFAFFSYDGVPDYFDHSAESLTSLPVYHLITNADDLAQCWAYDQADRVGSVASRKKFNWEAALVCEGVVYDHIGYRLRQRNDRYAGQGRRSMRFRFRRGNYFQARDPEGEKYPAKWRSLNTSKMSRFSEGANWGMRELISSRLWNLAGVVAPRFQHVHFRVIDDAAEQPDQYRGDFYGLAMVFEDADAQFLESRNLPPGNVYKLKDGEVNPLELQKYQAREAVSNGSDFINIQDNLGPPDKNDQWLRDHVDWESWFLYAALGEGFRHYDFSPFWKKNRIWYFKPAEGTPYGLMSVIPHDTDATWKRGTNDSQWNDPRWGPGPGSQRGRVVGVDLPKEAIQEISGLDGSDGENHPEREAFMLEYRNVIREVRDLLWQPDTVNTVIDQAYENIAAFSPADPDRWSGGPAEAGHETIGSLESQVALMKQLAFTEDLYQGNSLAGGRAQWLTELAIDPAIPNKPTITHSGDPAFPSGGIGINSSAFADPQGAATFAAMEWRIAEISGGPMTLLPAGSTWRFLDNGSDQGTTWHLPGFDDSAWASGATPAGYGTINDTPLLTTIDFGPDSNHKHITTYFRRDFIVPDLADLNGITLAMNIDDGVVVYLNGEEVLRDGFNIGTEVTATTLADSSGNEGIYDEFQVPVTSLTKGANTIAVELHQQFVNNSDLGFDLRITAEPLASVRVYEWNASWESGELTTFQSHATPPAVATRAGSTYRARVRHQDTTGRWSHWSDPLEFTASQPDIDRYSNSLILSEIMYHPSTPSPAEIAAGFTDDDDFEYIEIRNVGDHPLDLSDVRFTKGIDLDLRGTIAPGGFVLVVNNLAAFEMRYGLGLPVIGEWEGKLNNGGEQIKLSYGAGIPIRDFVFDDVTPWPTSPDGGGSSLVLINPFNLPAHGDPFSWRASSPNPGDTDTTKFTGGKLLDYAIRGPIDVTSLPGGMVSITVELNQLAEDLALAFETSDNLVDWTEVDSRLRPVVVEPSSGAYARVTFETNAEVSARRFFRIVVTLR